MYTCNSQLLIAEPSQFCIIQEARSYQSLLIDVCGALVTPHPYPQSPTSLPTPTPLQKQYLPCIRGLLNPPDPALFAPQPAALCVGDGPTHLASFPIGRSIQMSTSSQSIEAWKKVQDRSKKEAVFVQKTRH